VARIGLWRSQDVSPGMSPGFVAGLPSAPTVPCRNRKRLCCC
jgi:hypothetical protein